MSSAAPISSAIAAFECKRFIPTGASAAATGASSAGLALALQVGKHRVEYLRDARRLPLAQRRAVERSPNRIR